MFRGGVRFPTGGTARERIRPQTRCDSGADSNGGAASQVWKREAFVFLGRCMRLPSLCREPIFRKEEKTNGFLERVENP